MYETVKRLESYLCQPTDLFLPKQFLSYSPNDPPRKVGKASKVDHSRGCCLHVHFFIAGFWNVGSPYHGFPNDRTGTSGCLTAAMEANSLHCMVQWKIGVSPSDDPFLSWFGRGACNPHSPMDSWEKVGYTLVKPSPPHGHPKKREVEGPDHVRGSFASTTAFLDTCEGRQHQARLLVLEV